MALKKFGTPTPMGKHERSAPRSEIDLLLETLQRLAQGAGIAIPEDQEITFLEATRRSGGDHAQFCKYMDALIVEAVLLQTATTEMGPWKGTAEVQKLVRDERVATLSRTICAGLNRTVARWLTDWNYPGAACPRVVREIAPPEDLNARAARDEIVSRMSGMRPARRYIEDTYGGEWEDAPAPSAEQRFAFAGAGRDDSIDRALAAELDGWQPLMEPMIEPVLDAIRNADGYQDARDGLGGLYGRMDETPVATKLHRAAFSAGLSGEAGLVDDEVEPDGD